MYSRDFVIQKINELAAQFPGIQCRYEMDEGTDSHYIEILPKKVYELSAFKEVQKDIILEFIDQYPYESLAFQTEGALLPVEEPIYCKTG